MKQFFMFFLSFAVAMGVSAKPPVSTANGLRSFHAMVHKISVEIALQAVAVDYQLAQTPQIFSKRFLKNWSKEDREFFERQTKAVKVLPKIQADEKKLTFRDDSGFETKIEFGDQGKHQFKVNGSMWVYNPRIPLSRQIEVLVRNHPPQKTSSFWIPLVLSEARADFGITAAIVLALATGLVAGTSVDAIKQLFTYRICESSLGSKAFQPRNMGFCKEWDADYKESKRKLSPQLDSILQMIASDKSNVLTKFKVTGEQACPDNNDGKDRVYKADLTVASNNQPISIQIDFTPQGKVKDFKLFSSPIKNEIARIEFDTDNFMKCGVVKNAQAATSSALINQNIALVPAEHSLCKYDTGLSTQDKGTLELLEDAVRFVTMRITKCTVQAIAAKVEKNGENEIGSPEKPKPNDKADGSPGAK